MDYDIEGRSEGYEEVPNSFLHKQRPRSGARRRRKLPLLIIGGGLVLCLVVLLLALPSGQQSPEKVVHRKTLELGGAGNLPEAGARPEAAAKPEFDYPPEAAGPKSDSGGRMESLLADLESRIQANHEQVMRRLAELGKRVEQNSAHTRQLTTALERLSARIEGIEKQPPAAAPRKEPEKQAASPEKRFYTVKKNDTLYSIARDNGLKLETLLKINGLKEGAVIYPGDRLLIEQ